MRSSARKFSNFYSSAPVTASLFICAGKYAILGAAPFPLGGTILTQAGGFENCDAVAAVSEDDSVNLMAAQIAKSIFQREKVICRVSDPHLQVLYHKVYGLETICPTILTEQAVFRALAK